MSALVGILHHDGKSADMEFLNRQCELVAYHAPGHLVTWAQGPVALGVRLAPAAERRQYPGGLFGSPDGRFQVAFAGSLYNAATLAQQIAADQGGPWPASSGEIVLALFQKQGTEGIRRCNGAFTAAIWDRDAAQLVLLNDQLGLQTLVFWHSSAITVFGSEPKVVVCHPLYRKEPDPVALAHFLSCNRYLLQDGRTFYRDVERTLPGSALTVTQGRLERSHYWQLTPQPELTFNSDEECVHFVRNLMLDAVRLRLPDHDRFGAALSGGFDSSSMVCMADELNRTERGGTATLDTFSYNFGSIDADELDLIERVADKTGARHHGIEVCRPDFFADLDAMLAVNDGPVLESGVLLLWKKKKEVQRQGLDSLLSGLGGDELFMGRNNYFADLLVHGHLGTLYQEFRGAYPHDYSTGKRVSLKKLLLAYIVSPLEPYWLKDLRKRRLGKAFPPEWIQPTLARSTGLAEQLPRPAPPHFPTIYEQDCYEVFYYELLGGGIRYQEVASAAFGIETLFPLLDIRLVETMFRLPREWKLHKGRGRRMQKATMQPYLPKEILIDHLKKDFHPILDRYLQDHYGEMLRPVMESRQRLSSDYIDWKHIDVLYQQFLAGGVKPYPLWVALNIEKWLRHHF